MVKIERSFPAPASLESEAKKVSGSYEQPDVVSRLRKDFHDKCYICELKNLQDPQVEHLLPHKNGKYPERKFDWNNLFWSCSHCNGIKNQKKYDDGIIDCCKNDPELMMTFKLKDGKTEIYFHKHGACPYSCCRVCRWLAGVGEQHDARAYKGAGGEDPYRRYRFGHG